MRLNPPKVGQNLLRKVCKKLISMWSSFRSQKIRAKKKKTEKRSDSVLNEENRSTRRNEERVEKEKEKEKRSNSVEREEK